MTLIATRTKCEGGGNKLPCTISQSDHLEAKCLGNRGMEYTRIIGRLNYILQVSDPGLLEDSRRISEEYRRDIISVFLDPSMILHL